MNEVKTRTKFIDASSWLGYALDAAEYMLSHPTMDAGVKGSYKENISAIGKKRIYYSKADIYEDIHLTLEASTGYAEASLKITRSGFGAVSSYSVYSGEDAKISVSWGSSSFDIKCSSNVGQNFGIRMEATSVNSVSITNTNSTTMISDTSSLIIGTANNPTAYTENTFFTNSRELKANHTLLYASGKYWKPCVIDSPIMSDVIIDNSNIGDFAPMGFYFDIDGNLQLDPDILAAYITGTLAPELELLYRQAYQNFPEPDADINDPDIDYMNPFGDDDNPPETTEPSGGGYYPPAYTDETYVLDTSAFDIDYNSAVQSPYDELKDGAKLPGSISSSVGKVFSQAFTLVPPEILSVYGFLMLLSVVMWFIFRR